MDITYKKLTENELDVFIQMRINQLREEGATEDLGVDREYEGQGIGRKLMETAHIIAGGEKDIAVYLFANENAIPFCEKLGMKLSDDVMQYNKIEWTEFTVE